MIKQNRGAGVLLHPSSLPSVYGIGDFGPSAERFVDFLAAAGQRYWQVLPLSFSDVVGSPYAPPSVFALSWLFVSPDRLVFDGFVDRPVAPWTAVDSPVHYRDVANRKERLLLAAWGRFRQSGSARHRQRFVQFQRTERPWLHDAVFFFALKDHFGHDVPWTQWPGGLARRRPSTLRVWRRRLRDRIAFHTFAQWIVNEQWAALRRYANRRGIAIIGDLPHFVVRDSVDTWADPKNYLLDRLGRPRLVAGVPPDYFSPRGQVWGNPMYNWPHHRRENFRWWHERFRRAFSLYDIVRLDHFRGFVAAWGVRSRSRTARRGHWHTVPGLEMFRHIRRRLPHAAFVAEDLGDIGQDVVDARNRLGFPGIRVLQFGFDDLGSYHALTNLSRRSVAYTGTHDNNTTRGWFAHDASRVERRHARVILGANDRTVAQRMIKALFGSRATTVIFPLQDHLNLGGEARFNTPGTRAGNWRWRVRPGALSAGLARRLRRLTTTTQRA